MKWGKIALVLFLTLVVNCRALSQQNFEVQAEGIPLNTLLFRLRDRYGIQFSFNDRLIARYKITLHQSFGSQEEMLSALLNNIPFTFEKSGDVFIIYSAPQKINEKQRQVLINGQVVEEGTLEPLPFSYIVYNQQQIQADANGHFSFLASADTTRELQISHLGYFKFDTLVSGSLNQIFLLKPSVTALQEVRVESGNVEKATLIGNEAGKIKINHSIAPYLPTSGDNSIFSVLRLMPGVLAAGEQSNDFFISGAYEGQTRVSLDGITLFGLKQYNDNIGAVNPLYIKSLRVFKSGTDAGFDDRVGGRVEITGKNGNNFRPSASMNLNNTTLSLLGETPLTRNARLVVGFRTTFYQLFNPYQLNSNDFGSGNMMEGNGNHNAYNSMVDIEVVPDYKFNDANLKYSYDNRKGTSFSVIGYGGSDKFAYHLSNLSGHQGLENRLDENNRQAGAAAVFSKQGKQGGTNTAKVSYSYFDNDFSESNSTGSGPGHGMGGMMNGTSRVTGNSVQEAHFEFNHRTSSRRWGHVEAGAGFRQQQTRLSLSENDQLFFSDNTRLTRFYGFAQAKLQPLKNLILTPGLRVNYSDASRRIYVSPRLASSLSILKNIKWNAAVGSYRQFISKVPFVDENRNYQWFWLSNDGTRIPVLKSMHLVSGVSFSAKNTLISAEGFYKTTGNISKYFSGTGARPVNLISGVSRAYGLDIYAKQEFGKNIFWVAYSLGKVEENLPGDRSEGFQPAPHDQRHELKAAAILNYKSWYFSTSYVYGSGFYILKNYASENAGTPFYSRLDAALVYKFARGKVSGNVGFSVLNITNRNNIRYTNLRSIDGGDNQPLNVFSGAVPFSPAVFLMLHL